VLSLLRCALTHAKGADAVRQLCCLPGAQQLRGGECLALLQAAAAAAAAGVDEEQQLACDELAPEHEPALPALVLELSEAQQRRALDAASLPDSVISSSGRGSSPAGRSSSSMSSTATGDSSGVARRGSSRSSGSSAAASSCGGGGGRKRSCLPLGACDVIGVLCMQLAGAQQLPPGALQQLLLAPGGA
jgi:hypothetical protein